MYTSQDIGTFFTVQNRSKKTNLFPWGFLEMNKQKIFGLTYSSTVAYNLVFTYFLITIFFSECHQRERDIYFHYIYIRFIIQSQTSNGKKQSWPSG